MIKFIIIIVFINFIIVFNNLTMFYYRLCYVFRFFMIFMFMGKDVEWFSVSIMWGCNYYSIVLVVLRIWIIALMFICLRFSERGLKLFIFISMLLLIVMFFRFTDFMLFYLVFEIRLIPTFFLIIYWGRSPERMRASYYIIIYILLISFPLLVYVFDIYMCGFTTKFILMSKVLLNYDFTFWGFFMIYMAFFIKIPIYMFHVWLPKAHVEAPVYGSIILAGVLLKIGGYGLIRLAEVFYSFTVKYGYLVVRVAIVGRVIIRLVCLVQVDIKIIVAYSSIVHINLILCSLMTLRKVGMLGRYVIIISHGLCSSGIFYIVNLFYRRSGSRMLFLNKGILGNLPSVVMWWFLFCVFNFSFPLSLNFIGEVLILIVVLNWDIMILVYLMLVRFFRASYSLYLFSYISHGKNQYYENKVYGSMLKEYIVLIVHFFPLVGFLFNLGLIL